jgi:hypothetical protein
MRPIGALFATAALLAFASGCGDKPADHDHDHDHDHGHGGGHAHVAPEGAVGVDIGEHFAHLAVWFDSARGEIKIGVYNDGYEKGERLAHTDIVAHVTFKKDDGSKSTVELKLAAQANELSGEKPGDSSVFVGTSDALKGVKTFEAHVPEVTIRGQKMKDVTFTYAPRAKPSGHDDHDHGDHDHDH